MANKLKKIMKPILKQKCSEAYQEGYKKGMYIGFKQKKLAYESEIDCLKKIQFALHRSVPKWIPVTERLPEQDGWYMVYTKNKGDIARRTNKAQYCHHSWNGNGGRWDNVTHWMPLPEPPKEDEEDDN